MGFFQHHPDGGININGFVEPLAEFLVDEPGYTLAPRRIGRFYEQGKGHHAIDDEHNQCGGEAFPWPEGDLYISKKATYQSASALRNPPPPPLVVDNTRRDALTARIDDAVADATVPARVKAVLSALRAYVV